jgi:hypothetical protein
MAGNGMGIWYGGTGGGMGIFFVGANHGSPVYEVGSGYGMQVYETGSGYGTPVWRAGCFPATELVNTSLDSFVPIGALEIGSRVISYDVENGKELPTAVTGIHDYTVNEIICFNGNLRVSSSHPLMVTENVNGVLISKWKVAFDVKIGDCIVASNGKRVLVKTRDYRWYDRGIKVLNLSTDNGQPFVVKNCVVRAENAADNTEWADTPVTKKLLVA